MSGFALSQRPYAYCAQTGLRIMKLSLTRAQLLQQWRLRAFPEPMNDGGAVSSIDGIDMDAWLEAAMTDWYLGLLRSAPVELLYPQEYAGQIVPRQASGGAVLLTLPDTAVRPVALRMRGWNADAEIVTDTQSPTAVRQLCALTRAGIDAPVAVWQPGSRTVMLYPLPPSADADGLAMEKAGIVVDIPDTFMLDSAAFATITPLPL